MTSSAHRIDIRSTAWHARSDPHSVRVVRQLTLVAVLSTAHWVFTSEAFADGSNYDLPCLGACDEQEQQAEKAEAIGKILYKALENSRNPGEKILVLGIGKAVDELGYDSHALREYISEQTTINYGNGSVRFRESGLRWKHEDALTPHLIYNGQLEKDKMAIGFEFRF